MADSASSCFSCAGVRMPEARCRGSDQHRKHRGEEQKRGATGSGSGAKSHDFSFTSFDRLNFTTINFTTKNNFT
jgi:hypothetical protein